MLRPMETQIMQLPSDVQVYLEQDYSQLKILYYIGSTFMVEGIRRETSLLELVESTSLNSPQMVQRLQNDFENCASEPTNRIRALDSRVAGNHFYARYSDHGSSLYRHFVHARPYIGGENGLDMLLDHLPEVKQLSKDNLVDILKAAIGLCCAVEDLHDRFILHNNINPFVIFMIEGEVVLRGRCLAIDILSEQAGFANVADSWAQNLLPYLSPEASGRTNKRPDFRSDIYSIGCTLYELLTGRPPLLAPDVLGFLHRHLTAKSTPAHEVSPSIPPELGAVLDRCLQKSPDMRYQSVAGLKYDLQQIRDSVEGISSARKFSLGSLDDLMRFNVSDALCGRQEEMRLLRSSWTKVLQSSRTAIVVLIGKGGVGKSYMMGTFLKENQISLFGASKYQQFRRSTAYLTLFNALQNLVRQVLTHDQRDIRLWRAKLIKNKAYVAILAETVPELNILLGTTTSVENTDLSPHEANKRLIEAFVYVFQVFSQNGLILFQDDVQWATQAEVDLITEIATNVPRTLLVLSRRPAEEEDLVDFAMDAVSAHDVPLQTVKLANLSENDVSKIVKKTLHGQMTPEIDALARYVYEKTHGNPFFVSQLLHNLYRNGKIYFYIKERRWRFNIKGMKGQDLTDDIVGVINSHMLLLNSELQQFLFTASALGRARFSAYLLSVATGQPLGQVHSSVLASLDHNILKRSVTHIAAVSIGSEDDIEQFEFLHERTQENAYALMSAADVPSLHYGIMTNLRKHSADRYEDEEDRVNSVFTLANQYNKCLRLLSDEEKLEALECNIAAAKYALRMSETSAALYYLEVASYIGDKSQAGDAHLFLTVQFALIETYLAANAYDKVLSLISATSEHCKTMKDVTRCNLYKMRALLGEAKFDAAVDVGLSALDHLRCPLPANEQSAKAFAENMALILPNTHEEIMKLSENALLADDNLLLVQEVLSVVVLPVYMCRVQWLAALCYLSLSITVKCGPSLQGAYPVMMLGAYLSSVGGRVNLLASYSYGRFALNMLDKFGGTDVTAPGMYHLFAGHICVFHRPMSEVIVYEDLAVSTGKANFNVEYTTFSLVEKPVFLCWDGQGLRQTVKDLMAHKNYIVSTRSPASSCFLAVHLHGIARLADDSLAAKEAILLCEDLKTDDPGYAVRDKISITHAFMWELWRLYEFILSRELAQLRQCIRRCCVEFIDGVLGTHYAAMAFYLSAMAISKFALLGMTITSEEAHILEKGRRMLREFAELSPSTYMAKHKMLEIFVHRQSVSDNLLIFDQYEDIIADAEKHNNNADLSFALESLFRWLVDVSPGRSKVYLTRAYQAYAAWGCFYKTALLEEEFPWLAKDLGDTDIARPARPGLQHKFSGEQHTDKLVPPTSNTDEEQSGSNTTSDAARSKLLAHSKHTSSAPTSRLTRTETATESVVDSNSNNNNLSDLDIKTVLNASIQIGQGMKAEEVFENLMQTVVLAAGADYGVLALNGTDDDEDPQLSIHTVAKGDEIQLMKDTKVLDRPDLLPLSIVRTVMATSKPIIRNDSQDYVFDSSFARDRYYLSRDRSLKSILCMAIPSTTKSNAARGVLYLENNATSTAFTSQRLDCLTLLCTQSAMTLERAGVYQEMRAAKRQAEEATAQKSTFLANMSHEIRTPFNALLSCAIFLLDTDLNQVQKDYVVTIRDSATLTLSIIDGILDFSKVEQGMMDIVIGPFSLSENIETAMQVVAQKASKAGIDLVYSRKHQCDRVFQDSHHLRQVILNLLGNAVKFTSEGYVKVTSSTKAVLDNGQHLISIVVQDTGIGISQSGVERLFKAFSQVDASINRAYGGTGLGLAISKKLIEMMGGKVWVESVEGQGSKFFIEIALEVDSTHDAKNSMEIDQSDEIKKQGRLALVFTRFHSTADVMIEDLTEIGLIADKNTEILDADSIAEAAKRKPYSILFVDLQVDGAVSLIQSLQKILPSAESHFKIVILTQFGLDVPRDLSPDRIVGYLIKPIPKKKLRASVSHCLQSIGESSDEGSISRNGINGFGKGEAKKKEIDCPQQVLRILLAEDNIINTKVALQHLKRLGYTQVVHAKDGVEVLEQCAKAVEANNMFDLILMDVQMPRLDGMQATQEIVRRYPARNTRPIIIALTANATSADKEKCLDAGMSGHLAKPILPDDLKRTLESVSRR